MSLINIAIETLPLLPLDSAMDAVSQLPTRLAISPEIVAYIMLPPDIPAEPTEPTTPYACEAACQATKMLLASV